jgi:hypothetical protein
MKREPLYKTGDMIQSLNSPIPVVYIILESYWTSGSFTYELLAPDVPHKSYYKQECILQANYKVIG